LFWPAHKNSSYNYSVTEHHFDWKGLLFVLKATLACAALAGAAAIGSEYALPYLEPMPPTPILADAAPAALVASPLRAISAVSIAQVVPAQGKFITADLVHMELTLYQDGTSTAQFPILTKGRPGTPYETPAGEYRVLTKEEDHYNRAEAVHMPYSMEFYGNYFIHGWPTYDDGTPVASTYSGGCIRLSTDDAAEVYAFAERGTGVFVYDTGAATSAPSLALAPAALPHISAASYLVADLDNGDVYAEQNANIERPIASVTKLMTALVANETIMFDRPITVPRGILSDTAVATDTAPETFVIGDLLYPLLMESNNNIADALAKYYGQKGFVAWMNSQARALDMASTTFADASGVSPFNVSTPEDLYRLAVYLANKKSFVLKVTRAPQKTIAADDGSKYSFQNFNEFAGESTFIGGKVGHTTAAQDTMVSVFSIPQGAQNRRIAVIVLGSSDYTDDTKKLAGWFASAAEAGANTACAGCALPQYRQIEL
jgi:hypothetical protein